MIQQTIEKLKDMKLFGFLHALNEQLETTTYTELSFEERLGFLVEREALRRTNNRVTRLLKNAQLKQQCIIEDVEFSSARGISKVQVLELAGCQWVENKQNLIITGPTGAGKSFIACAIAHAACQRTLTTKYFKMNHLVQKAMIAKADGSYIKFCTALDRTNLIVIDEWLRDPLSATHAREVLDLIDDRFRKASTIFASQMPVASWHSQIQDPTIADAILDRVIHDAHRVNLKGDSMRKKTAKISRGDMV